MTELKELRTTALSGLAWTLVAFSVTMALRLGSNLILTRLLAPTDFELMTMAAVVMTGLGMLSDTGIVPSIVRSPRGDDQTFLNTAWTMHIGRGCMLLATTLAIAVPVARFYEQHDLRYILPVAGFGALVASLESTKLYSLKRRMKLRPATVIDIQSQAAGIFTMVALALATRSVWALVVGSLCANVVKTLLTHRLEGPRNGLAWDRPAVGEIVSFGWWVFLSTAISFLSMQGDKLILGKITSEDPLGEGLLGIYGVAATLAVVPQQIVAMCSESVLMPLYSRLLFMGPEGRDAAAAARRKMLFAAAVPTGLFSGLIGPAVTVLYDPRWHAAGPIAAVLSATTWVNAMQVSYGALIIARGKPKFIALGTFLKATLLFACSWLAYSHWGMIGVAFTMMVGEVLVLLVCYTASRDFLPGSHRIDALATLLAVAVGGGVFGACEALAVATGSTAVGVVGVGMVLGAVAFHFRAKLREFLPRR
ncbi:MAG: oligosaccharide flippase family protein [Planctomycetes bacterium]|nr:oligosaccharide flippase family protein [Planctomycetota bacterium]MCB9886336.1 oligosaccharide flippase family protein [Planctomycetota bacterium]